MKVPPKRKGNLAAGLRLQTLGLSLNESPSEKEGKSSCRPSPWHGRSSLNESPSEKEGKYNDFRCTVTVANVPQ